MSQSEKAQYYAELKAAGVTFDRHYREYTTDSLRTAVEELHNCSDWVAPTEPIVEDWSTSTSAEVPFVLSEPRQAEKALRQSEATDKYAGEHSFEANAGEKPLRVDEKGLEWYREEIRKPAFPKPRVRRKLTYVDTGVKQKTVLNGQYLETFEVAGDEQRQGEIRITLPTYQVGVYKDPRFPFKIHIYNGNRGFDLFDVIKFYGGADLVPGDIKRVYVENDLCYDMRTTIRAIETEYREQQLRGKIK